MTVSVNRDANPRAKRFRVTSKEAGFLADFRSRLKSDYVPESTPQTPT
jgi:hypothetical protein